MRTILFVSLGVIAFLLAAVLMIPSFFDWNEYKPEIAAEVKARTGRDLEIGGDISLRLVPSPGLVVENIRLANVSAGVAEDMVRLAAARVDVAFWPLLALEVEVREVHLLDAEIVLESFGNGRNNWTFEPVEASAADPGASPDPDAAGGREQSAFEAAAAPAIRLDRIVIDNATIIYRDLAAGSVERIEALSATLRAGSLNGPVEAQGRLRVRETPLDFDLAIGNLREQTMVPARLLVREPAAAVSVELRGDVFDLKQVPRFKGTVRAEGDFLSAAIQRFSPQPVPGFLAQPFVLDGTVDAAAEAASLEVRELRLGDTVATGTVEAKLAAIPVLEATLAVRRVDLDTWLSMPPARVDGAADAGRAAAGPSSPDRGAASPAAAAIGSGFPRDLDIQVALSVEAVAYRGGVVQDAQVNTRLADGEITVSQVTATVPGAADLALFGFVTAPEGRPRFDGEVEFRALDFRSTLNWLGVRLDEVPAGRLRTVSARGSLAAAAERIEARDLAIDLDGMQIAGGMTVVPGDRPALGIGVSVDRLDLDDYLPAAAPEAARQPEEAGGINAARETGPAKAGDGSRDDPAPALNGLAALDADVRVRAGEIGWRGLIANDVLVEGQLIRGEVTLEQVVVGDLAGASGALSGRITGLPEQLVLDGLQVQVDVADPARLARALDERLPPEALAVGPITASVRLDGPPDRPAVDGALTAAGARLHAKGTVDLAAGPGFRGRVRLQGDDLSRLLAALGGDYRPAGPLGATDLSADGSLAGGRLSLQDLSGALGGVTVNGRLDLDAGRQPASISADLATGDLAIDRFLPAKRRAGALWRLIPAGWPAPPRVPDALSPGGRPGLHRVALHPRWSTDPVDLQALNTVAGEVTWRSQSVTYDAVTARDVQLIAALAEGTLTIARLDAELAGGTLSGSGRLEAAGAPAFAASATLRQANLAGLTAGGGGIRSGRLSVDARVSGRGGSEAEMISSLSGDGRLDIVGLDPAADLGGLPVVAPMVGSVLQTTATLDAVIGGLLGGGTGRGLADIRSSFTIDRGVVIYDDLQFRTPLISGTATGRVNLPAWTLDTRGTARLDQSQLAGNLLARIGEIPDEIRFQAQGPLDDPRVRVDTSGFKATFDAIPGIESLRKQPGVGEALDKLLPGQGGSGGGDGGRAAPVPPAVEDLLKGIFR